MVFARQPRRLATVIGLCILGAAPVRAAQFLSFAADAGNDANTCVAASPCKTIARAIAVTYPGGTIVLGPGTFTSTYISKSISLVASGPGTAAVEVGTGKFGFLVTAENGTVSLEGIRFDGNQLNGAQGLVVDVPGAIVHVKNCRFAAFGTVGLEVDRAQAVDIADSDFLSSATGITISNAGANITIADTRFTANNINVYVKGGTPNVVIDSSVIAQSLYGGLSVAAGSVTVRNSIVQGNGTAGIENDSGTVFLTRSTITNNAVGVLAKGGTTSTFKDNNIKGNTADVTGTLAPLADE